jgi:hypothetical protein
MSEAARTIRAPRYARADGAIAAPVGDAVMVLNIATGDVFQLNASGSFVWRALDAPATLDEVLAGASAHFARAGDAAADIERFLRELVARGLVVVDAAPAP